MTEPCLTENPTACVCPHCLAFVTTEIEYIPRLRWFRPTCRISCISYHMIKQTRFHRGVKHTCPNCRSLIGQTQQKGCHTETRRFEYI